jgi:uncharacterized protein YcbX
MLLSEIWCYPVKSCAGIPLERAKVGPRGIHLDRHWMLINQDGRFVSQRQLPRMALIRPRFVEEGLRLEAPGISALEIGEDAHCGRTVSVQVWRDRCAAMEVGDAANAWFSSLLGETVRLVFLPAGERRTVDQDCASATDEVGFADGFPFLLIGRASLDDLAGRMGCALDIRRFRPNLVVTGSAPYAEDTWSRVRIGGLSFRVAKPCSRCAVTTVNPDLGERDLDTLGALRTYRQRENRVYFGQNLIHDAAGELVAGDPVAPTG